MMGRAKIAPPHSVILVSEPGRGDIPILSHGSPIAATASCIAIACRSEADGATEFILGSLAEVGTDAAPVFSGVLETPGNLVALQTVFNEVIIESPVSTNNTKVTIWISDPYEPDRIVVGLGI
jgi:hypothetical protein